MVLCLAEAASLVLSVLVNPVQEYRIEPRSGGDESQEHPFGKYETTDIRLHDYRSRTLTVEYRGIFSEYMPFSQSGHLLSVYHHVYGTIENHVTYISWRLSLLEDFRILGESLYNRLARDTGHDRPLCSSKNVER